MTLFKKMIEIEKSGFTLMGGLLFSLFFTHAVIAQDAVWLSNTPPKSMEKKVETYGMHRLSALKIIKRGERAKGRPTPKKYAQWLRKGSAVNQAEYICLPDSTDYQLTLVSPEGKEEHIEIVKDSVSYAKFELNEEGYYNTYLIIKKDLGDTLHINIAKAELLSHSCRNGHSKKLEARSVRYYPEIVDFEIIRQRNSHEDYHYFTSSGKTETYKALLDGKPLADVKVKVNTEKGWNKTHYTDQNGELHTQFIQDYFSEWQELNTREIYYYMLEADYTLKRDIHYKGKDYGYVHYSLTMSDGYRPSSIMYASMVWGLVVFLTVMIASIAGIFMYKERRKKPYKEITFNESND